MSSKRSLRSSGVAAKDRMSSVPDTLLLESAFTLLQFAVVSPLVALACRERRPA